MTAVSLQRNLKAMRISKFMRLTSRQLAKWARVVSETVAPGFKNWRRPVEVDEAEAERLDRIRNPSKYLGK